MKKILLFLLLYGVCYPQNDIEGILNGLSKDNLVKKCIASGNKNMFTLGKGFTFKDDKTNYVPIYTFQGEKTEFYLSQVGTYMNFRLYVFDHIETLKLEIGACQTTDGFDFLLYDIKTLSIYYLKSDATISICKTKKNILIYECSPDQIDGTIIKLNNRFMPVSSIKMYSNKNGIKKIKFSNYRMNNGFFEKNIKDFDSKYSSIFNLPYDEFSNILRSNPQEFDSKEICEENYCDSNISRFFFNE